MSPEVHGLDEGCAAIAAEARRAGRGRRPVVIAIDGASGAGKSALAARVAEALEGALVPADDFFSAQLTDREWDVRTPEMRAGDAIDWTRLRAEVLEPLREGRAARWRGFDFSAPRPDGSYPPAAAPSECGARTFIILDGIYSTREELDDLIDLAVLVEAPQATRAARLEGREAADLLSRWHARWDRAEEWYLTEARPRGAFDLIVRNP